MQAEMPIPTIYTGRYRSGALPWSGRLIAAGVAGACLAVLVVAALLEPSRAGSGTHTGLGLNRCDFLARVDLPCPSCGMTTSFSWFVRGNVLASLYVQPMGAVLAMTCAITFWSALYIAISGRPAYRLLQRIPPKYYLVPLFTLAVLGWVWKIVLHAKGIDGWG